MKKIFTRDNNLCINTTNFNSFVNNNNRYCYYESNTINVNSLFDELLDHIVFYNNALDYANLILKPIDNNIILYDNNGKEIEGNKISEKLNDLSTLGAGDQFDFLNNYTFEISDDFYEKKCSSSNFCELNGVKLFTVDVELKYMSSSEIVKLENIAVPEFNLQLQVDEMIN